MKKYLYILKSEIMSNLQYVFNIILGFIGYLIMIFILLNLWKYIYSDPSELINGYNMNQMIWYIIITELLWGSISGRKLCRKISDDVKNGNIAYNINKPYNYIGYALSNHLGDVIVKLFIYTILAMIMGYIFLGGFPNLTMFSILATIISAFLATIVSSLFVIFIGLFSFIIEDSGPFYWVYAKFILIIGTIFPIEFFPKSIQPIINYSPIYAISYGPAKLFVDFSLNTFLSVLISQIIYIFIGWLICSLLYKKGVRNLNVNGG